MQLDTSTPQIHQGPSFGGQPFHYFTIPYSTSWIIETTKTTFIKLKSIFCILNEDLCILHKIPIVKKSKLVHIELIDELKPFIL